MRNEAELLPAIRALIVNKTGASGFSDDVDIRKDLRCYGDDMWELLDEFAKQFQVDMKGFLWYFHSEEEGHNTGGMFVRPPNERVQRIPITPKMLAKFAASGKWEVNYPAHDVPKTRWDIRINVLLAVAFLLFLVLAFVKKC